MPPKTGASCRGPNPRHWRSADCSKVAGQWRTLALTCLAREFGQSKHDPSLLTAKGESVVAPSLSYKYSVLA